MRNSKIKSWMLTSLNGILAILFGIVAIAFPSITVVSLVIYFAISMLIGGTISLISSYKLKNITPSWNFLLIEGIISVLFGIIIISRPEFAAVVLITLIGIWSILLGAIFLFVYFINKVPENTRKIYLAGSILSLIFGLLIIINPFEGPRMVIILIGLYAITYGIFSIINNSRRY